MARFLFLFLIFLICAFAIVMMSTHLTQSTADGSLFAATTRSHLVPLVVVSQLVAVILTMSRAYLKQVSKVGMLLALFVLNIAILVAILAFAPGPATALNIPRIPEKAWLRGDSLHLYVEEREGLTVEGPVVVRFSEFPRMVRFEDGMIDPRAEILVIPATGESIGLESLLQFVYGPFDPPASVVGIGQDAASLADTFQDRWAQPPAIDAGPMQRVWTRLARYFWPVAWALVLVGLWAPVRATRWPLFNVLLTAILARGILLLPGIMNHPVVQGQIVNLTSPSINAIAVPLVWLVLGLFMLLLAALMPPLAPQQRGQRPTRRGAES